MQIIGIDDLYDLNVIVFTVAHGALNGGELSGSDYSQSDATGHLVGHVAALLPQPQPLRVGGVLRQTRQHHLAHELVLHCVAVPDLASGRRFCKIKKNMGKYLRRCMEKEK